MNDALPRFSGVLPLVRHWARLRPEAPALICEGGSLSYGELPAELERRRDALRAEGPQSLGLLCGEGPELVLTLLAALAAGTRLVLLDENAAEAQLREQAREARVSRFFGEEELAEELADVLSPPPEEAGGEVIFFTSGTTERAKGVVLTEASLLASAWNGSALLPLRPGDTLLSLLPLHHVFGLVCGLLWGLNCGAAVALGRGPRHYFDDFDRFRPGAVALVPALLAALMQRKALNPELELLLVGAGDCPPALLGAAKALGLRVAFGYGLTELSSGVALSLGVEEDPYAMTVCPEDRIVIAPDGEILVEAPGCVMRGYLNRPRETAEALRGGLLHTGDLGRLDEKGRLVVTGRKKEILVLPDGTKIFLPEYEAAIGRALGPRDYAALVKEGAPALVIRAREEERQELARRLLDALRDYPRGQQVKTLILTPSPLPRTATGKIQRWEVMKRYVESGAIGENPGDHL